MSCAAPRHMQAYYGRGALHCAGGESGFSEARRTFMLVSFETSQELIGWLNVLAYRNIFCAAPAHTRSVRAGGWNGWLGAMCSG